MSFQDSLADPVELIDYSEKLLSAYALLEAQRFSGYHDDDRFKPDGPGEPIYLAPQKNGYPKASEFAVVFVDYEEEKIWAVGSDADKIVKAIEVFSSLNRKTDLVNCSGTVRKLILKTVPRIKIDANGVLLLRLCDWNDVLWVLEELKVGIHCVPYPLEPFTPPRATREANR